MLLGGIINVVSRKVTLMNLADFIYNECRSCLGTRKHLITTVV